MNEFSSSLNVSGAAIDNLKTYYALLLKWQRAINLVSPGTVPDAWNRHFVDSAQILPLIPKHVKTIADLGCGGGFPGLVLAMLEPKFDVHLIESDEKKCQFMRTVSRETNTPVTIHCKRIERAHDDVAPDMVSARALASLTRLLDYCEPWRQKNTALEYLFLKGARAQEEVGEAQKTYSFSCDFYPSDTDPHAQILHIKDVHPL
ncbi:MAG: 16S rRNA (guanine(527)-N(7))-methyltransferase RsmG [Micavibrio sp.]|nr:16S rRNA (guanine(527)-N(7))-methyltransferase RsmG [Micavibrio sp.]|tara:strand:- start:607 stop:1218 length:612 start_codon:yes stop_codon:yes gene_type:complete